MSLGTLGGRDTLGMTSGLGLESTPACTALQKQLNAQLKLHGYSPIGEDGKCGAASCGAAKELDEKFGTSFMETSGFSAPGVCPNSTRPQKSGGSFSASSVVPLEPVSKGFLGMDTNTWLLVAAVAGGAYMLLGDKKKTGAKS